ncbi:sigma 54-interacting transcriptional regulator [Alkalimonas delamerensis]|uniref:Sigma 54-interacting transcriptional regulator n=2 Tax=Alkalimonas delamerensis TaxID=265981 RepID=A0ABT9GQ28_9GAMM|nr:sigma 54-interacting transcriptional regulator [Alkalimonas delamerensis]MDP4529078.1 sigma 54-interacting transcriptional regulator [Alkalimonas delamerensis]
MSNTMSRVLLVDDDPSLLRLLTLRLEGEGMVVQTADCAEAALEVLAKQDVEVVLSDLRMPGLDGMALFDEIARRNPGLPVILMTAHGSIPEAVAATQRGVFGFLTKPLDHSELRDSLQQALHQSLPEQSDWRAAIISRSEQMETVLQQAQRVAQRDVSVLITGASGTGKELLARAIHCASPRAEKPFVAINCGALPEHLLESELFGHTKGAFTGAVNEHNGLFREADGGTLFLDEIGDMPLPLQVKLLRALQERQIRPVGSSKTIPINVRVLSATHQDLQQAMGEGSFREDLYYRLNVVNLQLPALEQRPEDIPLLARHALQQSAERHQVNATRFTDDAMQLLTTAKWPGNVRQLVNVVEQCVALTHGPVISASLVEQALAQDSSYWPTLTEARDQFERQYLVRVLQMTDGHVTRAAELAGRNRTDFYKLLKKHDLSAQQVTEDKEASE